mgnify:CR=1 FL=1
MRERAVKICRNIENTLETMNDKDNVISEHPLYVPTRASRSILEKKLKELKLKYNIK